MGLSAGWYPQDDGGERFWDGSEWTDAVRVGEGRPPEAPVEAVPEPPEVKPVSKPPVSKPESKPPESKRSSSAKA